MTLVLRRADAPLAVDLGAAGWCVVGLCVVVAAMGSGPWAVVFLSGAG